MEELSSKMRNQVRRSFKECDIRRVTPEEMLREGYEVFRSATEHYRVKAVTPTPAEYASRIENGGADMEYWAAYAKDTGRMIAFCINKVFNSYCEYQTMKAVPEYQRSHYPYYGLIYEMNRHYLSERGLSFVNDGARSVTNHSNIQPFLIEKFKFRKAYCRLRIIYKWWLGLSVRLLYPFRRFIPVSGIVNLLNLEAMRRGEL